MNICGTPYVCLSIIFLYTPAVADVTRTANREKVPNGALPKIREGPHSLMGKPLDLHKKKRTLERWASLLPATAVSSCEHVAAVECVWQKLYTQDFIGQARFIFGLNMSGINGSKLSSFTGLGSHSVWLTSFVYRIILDKQDIYLDVTLSLKLLDEHYHRSLVKQDLLSEEYSTLLVGQVVISGDPDWQISPSGINNVPEFIISS